jgi:hypothetical protein
MFFVPLGEANSNTGLFKERKLRTYVIESSSWTPGNVRPSSSDNLSTAYPDIHDVIDLLQEATP